MLRKVPPGIDGFALEKDHDRIAAILRELSVELRESLQRTVTLEKVLTERFSGGSPRATQWKTVRERNGIKIWRGIFDEAALLGRDEFLREWRSSLSAYSKLIIAEFQLTALRSMDRPSSLPEQLRLLETIVRFELVGSGADFHREQRAGNWKIEWELGASGEVKIQNWVVVDEVRSRVVTPIFLDVTEQAFGGNPSFVTQLVHGTDYWRTVLDGASGIDIYGHNGVSAGDIDNDGFDDLYICQPAGLPNRMFRNRGDGTFEDITEYSGLGVLENTACALFADIDNDGRQDLIVVRASGPLLFLNEGEGKFRAAPDAFQFASPPQGTFTGAAIADYDRDGWLDIYFCLYAYYQGSDQYRYPMPYHDAENGPPNFMMRNNRDRTFHDVTKQTGLDKNNTRFSFCCAWGDANDDLWPDLYVVNDFGRKNLYRNNGDGTFTDVAREAGVEDVGAGMSVCWVDVYNDSEEDLYVANMWTAAGIRISGQEHFQKDASPEVRALYRKHAMGNSQFRNSGKGRFEDVSMRAGTSMGRWAWSSDSWDFDHDGFADIYIANGMISGTSGDDLNSFFWRQVVANSPTDAKPNHEYELGWNAINELIRSDGAWSGFERNVSYLNNADGTFSDVSGIVGLDAIEDSRTFALADFDHDGRLEVLLKNRNGPQLRLFKNVMAELSPAIAFRLSGKKSNRDAIGACVTIETSTGRQTRRVQAGSGFLAQHSKELFFGLGAAIGSVRATVRWPSGLVQELRDLPMNHRVSVEEGSAPVRVGPFSEPSPWSARAATSNSTAEILPTSVETWLLVPIPAPDFSLPTEDGKLESLATRRGQIVLLHFGSGSHENSRIELETLEKYRGRWSKEGVQLLAFDVDPAGRDGENAKGDAGFRTSLPLPSASADVIAIYNLLHRHVFDRHRDMSIPTSFLIDKGGAVVKLYQGAVPIEHYEKDFKDIPRTDAERLAKALPFAGLSKTYDFGRNYLSFGFVLFERGYAEQADPFYQLALREDPESAEAMYGVGSVYLHRKKNKEARESFQRALQLHASYPGTLPNAWNNLGILCAREGDTDRAIENFRRALEIDQAHSIALLNLGNAYRQKKDWTEAKKVLQRALEMNANDAETNYSLGMVFAQTDDSERAYKFLKNAIALRPAYPEALNNLGVLYLRSRKPEEAIRNFEESIRVAPEYDQAYLNLARVYTIQGEKEKTREVLMELLKKQPENAQANEELRQLNP